METMAAWLWDNVVPNVISSALIATALFVWFRLWSVRRAARTWGVVAALPFFGRSLTPPTIAVATSGIERGRPMTGIGQVRAIALITPSIWGAYRAFVAHAGVRMSADCDLSDSRFDGDLITIGGPKTNDVTSHVLGRIPLPDEYGIRTGAGGGTDPAADSIVWDGEELTHPESEPGTWAYGLVIRCENPIRGRGVLTVLAGAGLRGSGTYGTEAAASALVRSRVLRSSFRGALTGRRRGFVALVKAEVVSSGPVARLLDASVVDVVPIPWRRGA